MIRYFRDRVEAGRLLAKKLKIDYANKPDVLVLGLPRGGVPVAYQVAKVLNAPLDICLVRKLGEPGAKEIAMGAIGTGGIMLLAQDLVEELKIAEKTLKQIIVREWQELERREKVYRGSRPLPDLGNRTIILVDDGIATGWSMKAAISIVKQQQPKRIVVAVPIAFPDVYEELQEEVAQVVCLIAPKPLRAISLWYENFSPTTDEEVCRLLAENLFAEKQMLERVD
ncbi:MAG: phosphoribosyltransferase [Xenococcaceae cyanobacterium MO_167.B52]|nr:phosphoribosyltransferase [Xenococcaceae cyanobacterium MO_167.B52]